MMELETSAQMFQSIDNMGKENTWYSYWISCETFIFPTPDNMIVCVEN